MIALFGLFLAVFTSFKSKSRLEAENAALRHQLMLRRKVRRRVRLTNGARSSFVHLLSRLAQSIKVGCCGNRMTRLGQRGEIEVARHRISNPCELRSSRKSQGCFRKLKR
jgi:hypothetical protein